MLKARGTYNSLDWFDAALEVKVQITKDQTGYNIGELIYDDLVRVTSALRCASWSAKAPVVINWPTAKRIKI